ncbi:MAG: hypothetical protein ACYDBQ_03560 [Thermoplasmatota archaeon]
MGLCVLPPCDSPVPGVPTPGPVVEVPWWLVDALAFIAIGVAVVVAFHAIAVTRALRDWVKRRLER